MNSLILMVLFVLSLTACGQTDIELAPKTPEKPVVSERIAYECTYGSEEEYTTKFSIDLATEDVVFDHKEPGKLQWCRKSGLAVRISETEIVVRQGEVSSPCDQEPSMDEQAQSVVVHRIQRDDKSYTRTEAGSYMRMRYRDGITGRSLDAGSSDVTALILSDAANNMKRRLSNPEAPTYNRLESTAAGLSAYRSDLKGSCLTAEVDAQDFMLPPTN